ncbi:MAG TPA: HlyD family efflux transporter periplasmic adaptor subunit [Planctomycetota bacterium]|jgi:RND family efflux transporter MFP subunit|nr:HlyD family efflux transporter periplasmic adaptor subunit [Planctomycetota bacterium]
MGRRTLILVGGAAVLLLGLLAAAKAHFSGGDDAGKESVGTALATRGKLKITVTSTGTVKAKESKAVRSEIENRSEVTWIIEEGKEVKDGDLLVELDKKDLQKNFDQLEIQVSQVETEYSAAGTDLEIQKASNESDIKKAELKLEVAEKELEKYREGESKDQRRKLLLEVDKAKSELERAEKKHRDALDLEKEGFVTPVQVEEARIQFETWKVQKESADLALDLFEKYTHPMTLRQKEAAAEEAKSELERSRKTAESQLRQKEAALKQKERTRISTKEQFDRTKRNLEKCTIKAAQPGIVVYGNPDEPWMRQEVKVGMSVWQNHTILTIPNLEVLQVLLQIHETDIGKLKAGQTAVVTPEADPTRHLTGAVTKVAQIAGSRWGWDDEVKRFGVEVTIEDKSAGLKPSTSAKVEILVEEVPDVLSVPIQAVFAREGKSFVYLSNGKERPERRDVKPGRQNDTHVEIVEGLKDGEVVFLRSPEGETAGPEEKAEEKKPESDAPPSLPRAGS